MLLLMIQGGVTGSPERRLDIVGGRRCDRLLFREGTAPRSALGRGVTFFEASLFAECYSNTSSIRQNEIRQ